MVVRLRLARFGRKVRLSLVQVWQVCLLKYITAVLQHLPFYRIFAADARAPRDGKHLEVVGHYDPLPGQNGLLLKVVPSSFERRGRATINNQLAAGKDGNKHITLDIDRIK